MAKNDIQTLTPAALVALNQRIVAAVGTATPNDYLVPNDQMIALRAQTTILAGLNTDVDNAKAAYHGAVASRETARREAADAAAQVARTIYAVPSNTPGMIAEAGLSPRSASRAKLLPRPPSDVVATPAVDGTVLLKWARNGSAPGVAFLVEAQAGEGAWAFVGETTATRMALSGYAPGATASFRITASKNGTVSAYSPVATIYPVSTAPALRLAA